MADRSGIRSRRPVPAAATGHRNLTERILGLTLLGLSVPLVAEYLGVSIGVVKAERARCRQIAHDLIADVLLEADRG